MRETLSSGEQFQALQYNAEQGDMDSMFLLGVAYAQGKGVARDHKLAARWFHQASRRGHTRARTSLGFLYSTGKGVLKDPIIAYNLLSMSANEGDSLAKDLLTKLRKSLTPAQISEANKKVRENTLV